MPFQLAYCSFSPEGERFIPEIFETSRENNRLNAVTGLLLYYKRSIFQIVEGDASTLKALYQKIERDRRHTNVNLIHGGPRQAREFADWALTLPLDTDHPLLKNAGVWNLHALINAARQDRAALRCDNSSHTGHALMGAFLRQLLSSEPR